MVQEEIAETEVLYDFKQLEEIAAGNKDFIISLAQIFLKTVPLDSNAMVEAAKRADWQVVSKLAHKIKSTIDSLNITRLKSDIRVIEMDAKNKVNTATLGNLTIKVDNIIQQVAAQIKKEFAL